MSDISHFQYRSKVIEVVSEDADLITWLEEMLMPWFQVSTQEEASFRILVERDPLLFAGYDEKRASDLPRKMEFIGMDGEYRLIDLVSRSEDETVLYDPRFETFYFFQYQKSCVRVLQKEGTEHERLPIYFLLREYLTSSQLVAGLVPLHASALEIEGFGTIAFVGPKNSGKTSILCQLLLELESAFITNDRGFLACSNNSTHLWGMPTVVNIRRNTARCFPEVFEKVRAYHIHTHRYTMDELGQCEVLKLDSGHKLRFSTAQFCHLFNATSKQASGDLKAIVFPTVQVEEGGLEGDSSLQQISISEGRAWLERGLLKSSKTFRLAESFQPFFEANNMHQIEQKICTQLDMIAESIPMYHFRIRDGIRLLDAQLESLYQK